MEGVHNFVDYKIFVDKKWTDLISIDGFLSYLHELGSILHCVC